MDIKKKKEKKVLVRYFWSPPCHHKCCNISNVSWRKLDIVLKKSEALKRNRLCPFFRRLSLSISLYVSIWCNRIVLYLLGHMAMALSLLRAKEGNA